MVGIYLNHELTCAERRQRIFDGDLLLYSRIDATAALARHARAMIAQALAPYDPEHAQESLEVHEFVDRVGALKTRFTNDATTKQLVRGVLTAFGCDLDDTWFDVPRLRVVPHGGYLSSGVSYAYKAHRDTWYSSPGAQVNWWMPVFDVTGERAMSFFPEYWSTPVANSSARFDYDEWCRVGRQLATSQVGQDTRQHPLPDQPVETRSELRVAGTTADLILFSAAHLHSTAANVSGRTRFSIDFRTLHSGDVEHGRGAPNIDARPKGSTLGDFLRARDFARWPTPTTTGTPP
jgi:hypothetical protein